MKIVLHPSINQHLLLVNWVGPLVLEMRSEEVDKLGFRSITKSSENSGKATECLSRSNCLPQVLKYARRKFPFQPFAFQVCLLISQVKISPFPVPFAALLEGNQPHPLLAFYRRSDGSSLGKCSGHEAWKLEAFQGCHDTQPPAFARTGVSVWLPGVQVQCSQGTYLS